MLVVELFAVALYALLISEVDCAKCGSGDNYVARERHYCIAVVDVDWDYAFASSEDRYDLTGLYEENAMNMFNVDNAPRLGKYARKGLLRQFPYDSETGECNWDDAAVLVSTEIDRNGILGPVIRGVEGDSIIVYFYNNANTIYSGVGGDVGDDDGALYANTVFNLVPQGLTPSQVEQYCPFLRCMMS